MFFALSPSPSPPTGCSQWLHESGSSAHVLPLKGVYLPTVAKSLLKGVVQLLGFLTIAQPVGFVPYNIKVDLAL